MGNGMLSQEEIDALLRGTMESDPEPETPHIEDFLDEMEKDTLGEIANISMGTAATTLSQLLGKKVDITTPSVMAGGSSAAPIAQAVKAVPQAQPTPMSYQTSQQTSAYETSPYPSTSAGYPPPFSTEQGNTQPRRQTPVQPAQFAPLQPGQPMVQPDNLSLILDVPLQISVELGRAKKTIKEILEMGPGSVIELDRLAGESVDMIVNGKLIAKCEVVVINETFGIRITDIVHPRERMNSLK